MNGPSHLYPNARAVETAIKTAAKQAARMDPTLDTNKRIQLEYFNRFLSRVFYEGEASSWVLKGGAGILARIPSTRSTRDIDLYRGDFTLDQALEELRRLAENDLGDHFRFVYNRHETSIADDAQPYIHGCRVWFEVFLGASRKGSVQVDLAVGAGMTGEPQMSFPRTALKLSRLVNNPYRLYPIADQIADKVCATMMDYEGHPSSREKDLVDLVVFARTQHIDGMALTLAIETERLRRKLPPFAHFVIPVGWGRGYVKQSQSVIHCVGYPTVASAVELVACMIDPAMQGEVHGKAWSAEELQWV